MGIAVDLLILVASYSDLNEDVNEQKSAIEIQQDEKLLALFKDEI